MITPEQIERINYLARKSRAEGLTDEEAQEQKVLRAEYVKAFRQNLEATLNNTVIQRPDGTRERVTKKGNPKKTGEKQ